MSSINVPRSSSATAPTDVRFVRGSPLRALPSGADCICWSVGTQPRRPRSPRRLRKRLRVVIADAYPFWRTAFEDTVRSWPEFNVVGVASDEGVFDKLEQTDPDVLVVDPETIAVDVDELLEFVDKRPRVLLIATVPEPTAILKALELGATGFVARDCPEREICEAIAAVGRGQEILGASILETIASELRLRDAVSRELLSRRERQILGLVAQGLSNSQIAQRLNIGSATVKTHLHHLYERLGVHDRAQAVHVAMRRELIP